ncbi:MAG: hypothetical protein AAB535_01625 [Patescibacteria group bacterium]|mgnify:FL=1
MVINESISVGLVNNIPKYLVWKGRTYKIDKIGFHHTHLGGDTLHHTFSVVSGSVFLKIDLNTKNLCWRLEEILEGLSFGHGI